MIFAMVKMLEVAVHCRPRALWRILFHPDRELRKHMRWSFRFSFRVWRAEIAEFIRQPPPKKGQMTLAEWFGKTPRLTKQAAGANSTHKTVREHEAAVDDMTHTGVI